jgi:hypothetical protein
MGGPTPRHFHAMVAERSTGRVVLYGGRRDPEPIAEPYAMEAVDDPSYAFDGVSWTNLGGEPGLRHRAGLVFDDRLGPAGEVLLIGGARLSLVQSGDIIETIEQPLADAWRLSTGDSWRRVPVVGEYAWEQRNVRGAYDTDRGRVILPVAVSAATLILADAVDARPAVRVVARVGTPTFPSGSGLRGVELRATVGADDGTGAPCGAELLVWDGRHFVRRASNVAGAVALAPLAWRSFENAGEADVADDGTLDLALVGRGRNTHGDAQLVLDSVEVGVRYRR